MTNLIKTFKALKGLIAAASMAALVSPVIAVSSASAQENSLTERLSYIRQCRTVNRTVEVFSNSDLSPTSSRVGTFTAGTQITLTGVLREGRAQVYLPTDNNLIRVVGWVDAGALGACTTDDDDDDVVTSLCYRANANLIVRDEPTTASAFVTSYPAGATVYPTTNPPTERTSSAGQPNFGRIWMEVAPTPTTNGWISRTGPNGLGSNITPLPTNQCQR